MLTSYASPPFRRSAIEKTSAGPVMSSTCAPSNPRMTTDRFTAAMIAARERWQQGQLPDDFCHSWLPLYEILCTYA